MTIADNIKYQFSSGGYLIRLLYINCGVFILMKLALLICVLFELPITDQIAYLELPANLHTLLRTPWTLLTYMFVHVDFWHIIFNMLALYWFGRIFLDYLSQKQLVGVYVLGGLAGAIIYLIALNTIPYFSSMRDSSYLLGASASVMALVFAIVSYSPNSGVNLAFLGYIKLKYIGLFIILLDIAGFSDSYMGGTMAHVGGALFGLLYGYLLRKSNVDLTTPVTAIINFFVNIWPSKSNRKAGHKFNKKIFKTKKAKNKAQSQSQSNTHSNAEKNKYDSEKEKEARIDAILAKIKKSGYTNLTAEEKQELFDLSNKK